MLPIRIVATGCYIPSIQVPSTELDRRFGVEIGTVEKKTGVAVRYYGNDEETSPVMGARAVRAALDRAGLTIRDVDVIVSVSGTAAQLLPCTASLILAELGHTGGGVAAFDVNATCLSFMVGFDQMACLIASGRYRRVVIVAAEAGSRCLSPTELESASLIGDGAVALILERAGDGAESNLIGARFETYPEGVDHCKVAGLGTSRPRAGIRGAEPADAYFTMQGPKVFRLASQVMPGFVDSFLMEHRLRLAEFGLVVPHQASGFGVALMSRRLGIPDDKMFVYLKDYGNTIAASIPLGIHFAIDAGRLRRGDKVLCVGTGAGLSLGIVALTY